MTPTSRTRGDASTHSQPALPTLEDGALVLGERRVPLIAGALHYFRITPGHWRAALEATRDMGIPIIDTYVPWGVHELGDERFDFGTHDLQKDLGAFLDLADELELLVLLRPGPNVNAELPYFGLPRRVVLDERNQARSPAGRPVPMIAPPRMFAVPSYASRNFRELTARWFAAVAQVAAPHCYPEGPVVLLQVDNEAVFYFRDAPYDQDYHPDALTDYACFLERRHGTIATLNRIYGGNFASFDAVPPPERMDASSPAELPRHLDWMRFQEHLLADALGTMVEQLVEAGFPRLPTLHNLPMGEGGSPVSFAALRQQVDAVGLDFYHSRRGLAHVRRRALRLSGESDIAFAPELGAGAPPWFSPRSDDDSLIAALCACAYGVRGFNLYMAVDREHWYGAPIDADGVPRAAARRWRKLIETLKAIGFHRLRRRVQVALSIPREYALLARATHALGALSPTLFDMAGLRPGATSLQRDFGFEEPTQLVWSTLLARMAQALSTAGVPFTVVESGRPLAELEGLEAVIAPSYEFADPERWRDLHEFESRGGHVLWGPQHPSLDANLEPTDFEPLRGGPPLSVRDQTEAEDAVRKLDDALSLARPFPVTPRPVESTVHEDDTGPRVVFLVNPGAEPQEAEIHLPFPCEFRDALNDETFAGESAITVQLEARDCRMLLCERRLRGSRRPRPPSARAGRAT